MTLLLIWKTSTFLEPPFKGSFLGYWWFPFPLYNSKTQWYPLARNDAFFSATYPWPLPGDAVFSANHPWVMRFFLQHPHDVFWVMRFFLQPPHEVFWVMCFFCQPLLNAAVFFANHGGVMWFWFAMLKFQNSFKLPFAFSFQNHVNPNPGIQEQILQRKIDSTARYAYFGRSGKFR